MADGCLDYAKQLLKDSGVSNEEIEKAYRRVGQIRKNFIAQGKGDNLDERVAKRLALELTRKKLDAVTKKRQEAANIIARKKRIADSDTLIGQGLRPWLSVHAGVFGTVRYADFNRVSWARGILEYDSRFLGDLQKAIQKERPHLQSLVDNKDFDTAVAREMYELREGGQPGITKNSDAKWLADKFAGAMEYARTTYNKWGGDLPFRAGYGGPLVHNDIAMLRATAPVWSQFMYDRIDLDKAFPEAFGKAEIMEELNKKFLAITTNQVRGGERLWNPEFKNFEGYMEYRDKFGRGSVINGVFTHLSNMARITSTLEHYGPQPSKTLHEVLRHQKEKLEEQARSGDVKLAQKANKEIQALDPKAFKSHVAFLTGAAYTPENATLANIGENIRSVESMAKMGRALFSAFNDLHTAGSVALHRGQGFWRGVFTQMDGMRQYYGDEWFRQYMMGLNEGTDALNGQIAAAAMAQDGVMGSMAGFAHRFYKRSGLAGWTDAGKGAQAAMAGRWLGENSSRGFGKLNQRFQTSLRQNGITPEKWEAMRTLVEEHNGRKYIMPELARDLRNEDLKPLGFDKDRLELDIRGYIADEVGFGVLENDPRARQIMYGDTQAGNPMGEARRFLGQFKGWSVGYTQRVLGRAWNVDPNLPRAQRIMERSANLAGLVAGMTVTGYLSNVAADAFSGIWPPQDPFSPKTWGNAMIKGGGLGIYGDFLFGQVNTYNHPAAIGLLGPTFGQAVDLYSLYNDAKGGKVNAGEALNLVLNNTPYANLFYARPIMDTLILNAWHEWASPGYLTRKDHRLQKETGQHDVKPRYIQDLFQ